MRYTQINVKDYREAIYAERGIVCESCGEVWDGNGRRFPIHHWTYDPFWYQLGHYSVLCCRCHALITNRTRELWSIILATGKDPREWRSERLDEKEVCVRDLLKEWWDVSSG